jgi:hypothetical protein
MVGAEEIDQNFLLGTWKFHFTWGDLVDDTGSLLAKRTGNRIEFICIGCDAPDFLRGTISGPDQIDWEYWAESGIQGKCENDKGWRPVRLVLSPENRSISFWYILHLNDNCSVPMKKAPVKYTLTRD